MDYEKEIPFGAFNSELMQQEINIPEGFEANIKGDKIILKKIESDDDKIRKYLIRYIDNTMRSGTLKSKLLAWLEKQGKQKPTLRERYKNIAESEWFKKTHEGMSISDDEKVDNVNKTEPKFKVGDWITDDEAIFHITSYDIDYGYQLETVNGTSFHYSDETIEKKYRLWTIQDAKDGDVLAEEKIDDYFSPFVALYKKIDEECDFESYCFVGVYGKFYKGECGHSTNNIHPATKEQRDLLFSKMKEAGYEWDAEKKELKEIEDEEYNGEDYGIDSLWHAKNILEETLGKVDGYQTDDGILEHKCAIAAVNKLYKQKPAEWSEEDKNFMYDTLNNLTELKDRYGDGYGNVGKCIDWLKSLKNRYSWKPSDEQMKQLGWIAKQNKDNMIGKELISLYQDLKKLREE